MTLLDHWMPEADVTAAYAITVAAPASRVYDALRRTDFGRHPLIAFLMGLRAIPALLTAPAATWRRLRPPVGTTGAAGSLLRGAFVLLEDRPPEGLVLGLTGRFWTPTGGLLATDVATFRECPPPGTARAAWEFGLEALPDGRTRLRTETRVRCSDPQTRRRFRRYWRLVAPGSGLIRRAILRRVRQTAEAARD
jgi:hypothetical protein